MLFRNVLQCRRASSLALILALLQATAFTEDTAWDPHRAQEAYRERVAQESWEESLENLVSERRPRIMSLRMQSLAIGSGGILPRNEPQAVLPFLEREPRYLKLRALAVEGSEDIRREIHGRSKAMLEDWTRQLVEKNHDNFADLVNPEVVPLLHVQSSDDPLDAGLRVLRFMEADMAAMSRKILIHPILPPPDPTDYVFYTECTRLSIAALELALDQIAAWPASLLPFNPRAFLLLEDYARCVASLDEHVISYMTQYGTGRQSDKDLTPDEMRQKLEQASFWEKAEVARQHSANPDCPRLRDAPRLVHETFASLASALDQSTR